MHDYAGLAAVNVALRWMITIEDVDPQQAIGCILCHFSSLAIPPSSPRNGSRLQRSNSIKLLRLASMYIYGTHEDRHRVESRHDLPKGTNGLVVETLSECSNMPTQVVQCLRMLRHRGKRNNSNCPWFAKLKLIYRIQQRALRSLKAFDVNYRLHS